MQQNFLNADLNETFDDFEPDVEAVTVEGMQSIIDAIEGGVVPVAAPHPLTEMIVDGNGNKVDVNAEEKDTKPAQQQQQQQQQTQAPAPEQKQQEQASEQQQQQAEQSNKSGQPAEGNTDATQEVKEEHKEADQLNDPDAATEPEIGSFEKHYPKIAERLKAKLKENPEALGKILAFLNKDSIVKKIAENVKEGPLTEQPAHIDTTTIPKLVEFYNNNSKDKIDLNAPAEQANNAEEGNPEETSSTEEALPIDLKVQISMPKGFNKTPSDLGGRCTSTRFGYPMINFGSETVKEMLKQASDLDFLKTLVKEFVKETKNTPIANALGIRTMFGQWKKIVKRIRECGRAKCIPVVHKPVKIKGSDNIQTLFDGVNGNDITKVMVNPINTKSSQINESVDNMAADALTEGLMQKIKAGVKSIKDFAKNGQTGDNSYMDEPGIEIPIPFLAQFYEIKKPSSPEGMEKYTRYMSNEDLEEIKADVGDATVNAAKSSNIPFKVAMVNAYANKHQGQLPYYILTQRSQPRERLKVTPKPLLHDQYLVKSVDGINRAVGYFIDKDTREKIFELG